LECLSFPNGHIFDYLSYSNGHIFKNSSFPNNHIYEYLSYPNKITTENYHRKSGMVTKLPKNPMHAKEYILFLNARE
jgi:hypothetical protein